MSPSRAAGQDLAESRQPKLVQPLQATDRDRDVLGLLPLQAQPCTTWTCHTGSCVGQGGPYRHPITRQWGTASRGDWLPVLLLIPVLLIPVLAPASCGRCLWRAAGASGPGPAVESSGSCRAGGPGRWRGREGTPALRTELEMCRAECPGRPRGRKGWASAGLAWLGPQHMASGSPEPRTGTGLCPFPACREHRS